MENKLTDNQSIHQEALKRFEQIEDKAQRKQAIDDMRFTHVEGGQWDNNAIEKRKNRPRFTINRVAGAVAQIVGDQRQNRTSIKVRPVSNGANEKTAKVFNGLIRNIESLSKATNAYDAAFDESVTGGYGGWRVLTEFTDDDIFEQDIKIQPINSAASSLYFGDAIEYDKRDAKFAFLITNMPLDEFKAKWPKKSTESFQQTDLDNSNCSDWFGTDSVRIAEYWKKIPVKKQIALLSDGRVIDSEEEKDVLDEMKAEGITIVKTREVNSHKVVMYIMNGNEILEDAKDWAGKYIPLIPVYGKIHHIEGRTFVKGMVRDAKDPQRIYNYETSQTVETSALTPKDPYWYTPKMVAGFEAKWASFPTKNSPFMPYNPDEKHPGPPTRTGAPSVQTASLAMIAQASQDIHATTGLEPASMGNVPELKSGKAIQAQQAMGDRGAFIYPDNLQKSIQYTGEILVDLIPRIYDTARTVRILNVDGSSDLVDINQDNTINQTITDNQTGKKVIVNDLTIGKYDVVTDSGPSFLTKRMETADQLIQLVQAIPQMQQLIPDLIARNLDINDNEEIVARLRKGLISQGIVKPTDDEIEELGLNEEQKPDPLQVALLENTQMATQKLMADIEKLEADTVTAQVKAQQETVKTVDIMTKTMLDKIQAGIPLTNDEIQLMLAQRDILADAQDSLNKANSVPLLNQGQ